MGTVDAFIEGLAEPDRAAVRRAADIVMRVAPDAEQSTSYGMAAFRSGGKPMIGFTSSKNHLSAHPFSPPVVDAVASDLDGFSLSKGTIRFTAAQPIPDHVIEAMVRLRLAEIA
ncbi:MAG: DUF1801 domain-containing protein [Actinomycetota bacterium]